MSLSRLVVLAGVGLAALPGNAFAQKAAGPRALGTFQSWAASELVEKTGRACYMVARPVKSEGKYSRRGEVYAVVTHRPAQQQQNEVSIQSGYTFKEGSTVVVEIDKFKFELITRPSYDPGAAWSRDDSMDNAMVAAMQRGKTMTVRGTSSRGTETVDTFSLEGFTRAHQAIDKACGLKEKP